MKEYPSVSVVIPFFNSEKFFEETIQSVFAQSYPDWELLLVDDGSEDNSSNIALNYAKQYPDKVYYLEHENHANKGTSATRNLGINNAKGKYIATLDSDDLWKAEKLEQQVSILESNPQVGLVFGNTFKWRSWTGNSKDMNRDTYMYDSVEPNTLELNTISEPPSILIKILSNSMPSVSCSNIMFRKTVSDTVGGFEDNFTGMHDDYVFLSKVFLSSSVFVSEQCWDVYRINENSVYSSAKREGRVAAAELFYLNWLKQYIAEKDYNNLELLRIIRKRIWRYKYPRLYGLAGRIIRFKGTLFT